MNWLGWGCFGIAASVLTVAALLRGQHTPGHDELNFIETGLRMLGSRGNPQEFIHGSLLYDLMALVHAGIYGTLALTGNIGSPDDYLVWYLTNRGVYLLIGRLAVLACSLCLLLAVKRLAAVLYDDRAGVLAMALLGFGALLVGTGTLFKEDVPAAALGLLGLVVLLDSSLKLRPAVRSGVAGALYGIGTASKYTLVPLALIPVIVALLDKRAGGLKAVVIYLGGAAVAFLAVEPYALLDTARVAESFAVHLAQVGEHQHLIAPRYLLDFLPLGLGIPLVLAFLPAAVRAFLRDDPRLKAVVAYVAVAGAICLSQKYGVPRYMVPWAPFICIIVAGELVQTGHLRHARPAMILGLAFVLTWPANTIAAKYALLLTRPDTRTVAKTWIEQRVPGGNTVLVEGTIQEEPSFAPALLGTVQWYEARERDAREGGGTGRLFRAAGAVAARQQRPRYHLVQRALTEVERAEDFDYLVLSNYDSLTSEWLLILKPDDPEVHAERSLREQAVRQLEHCCRELFHAEPYPVLKFDWITNNPDYWGMWAADVTTFGTWMAGPHIRVYARAVTPDG